MSRITVAALADAKALRCTSGFAADFAALELDPAAGRIRFKPLFDTPCPEFRRLDILSRMFLILAEACDLSTRLDEATRTETAIVLASSTGCLAADQRFATSLRTPAGIEPAVFPYTLPSTCLGEVAIRQKLRGPTICLSVADGSEGEAIGVAQRLLLDDEARAALILLGDWAPGVKTRVATLLLEADDPDTPGLASVETAQANPFATVHTILDAPPA